MSEAEIDQLEAYARQLEPFRDDDCDTRMWVIAMETRTPLTVIRGYTEILRRIDLDKTHDLPDNFSQMLERIAQAERILSLVITMMATYAPLQSAATGQGGDSTPT